jgi:hypothetical protein
LHDNDRLKGIIDFVDRDKGPLLIALSRFLLEVWQIWEKDQSRQQIYRQPVAVPHVSFVPRYPYPYVNIARF